MIKTSQEVLWTDESLCWADCKTGKMLLIIYYSNITVLWLAYERHTGRNYYSTLNCF